MDNKVTKKTVVIVGAIFLLIVFLLSFLFTRLDKKLNQMNNSAEETTESTEETPSASNSQDNENSSSEDTEAAVEPVTEGIDSTGMTTSERNKTAALIASDVSISDKEGDQKVNIGNLRVSYNSGYATSASLTVSGLTMNAVLYNDGNEDDLKGVIGNIPIFAGITAPNTTEQCQTILEEYIPDGAGRTAEWEESGNYFVRKFSGYDSDDSCGVICYTIMPKVNGESNVYTVVLAASKADGVITPLSEDSFHSMIDPVAEIVPESTLVNTDYESTVKELKDIAYYETANGETIGGLYKLREAARSWNETVFGTDDPSTLTEEERAEKYWQYSDPEGYNEAKYYEAKREKDEAKASTEEGNIKMTWKNSSADSTEGDE